MKKSVALSFDKAFNYPFSKAKRMFNIFWLFLPIFGWLALGGYSVRIVQGFTKGKFKEMPAMKFGNDLELGFMMFLKALPFVIAMAVAFGILILINPFLEVILEVLFGIFVFPMLSINFMKKMTVESFFEFGIAKAVWNNMGDYLMAMLKSIGLGIIFFLMMIILVGIPAGMFTKNIFLADFYYRNVK